MGDLQHSFILPWLASNTQREMGKRFEAEFDGKKTSIKRNLYFVGNMTRMSQYRERERKRGERRKEETPASKIIDCRVRHPIHHGNVITSSYVQSLSPHLSTVAGAPHLRPQFTIRSEVQ